MHETVSTNVDIDIDHGPVKVLEMLEELNFKNEKTCCVRKQTPSKSNLRVLPTDLIRAFSRYFHAQSASQSLGVGLVIITTGRSQIKSDINYCHRLDPAVWRESKQFLGEEEQVVPGRRPQLLD